MAEVVADRGGIVIREIVEADIPGFRACLDAVARERRYLIHLQAPPLAETRTFIVEGIRKGETRLVALDGPDLIGWCDITPHHRVGLDHVGEMGIGLLKAYRGRGIGRALLRQAVRRARQRGLEKVELEVFASNRPAIRLYEDEGFQEEGRKRRARKLDGAYEDIIIMGLFL